MATRNWPATELGASPASLVTLAPKLVQCSSTHVVPQTRSVGEEGCPVHRAPSVATNPAALATQDTEPALEKTGSAVAATPLADPGMCLASSPSARMT
jgi:hypothetical protein